MGNPGSTVFPPNHFKIMSKTTSLKIVLLAIAGALVASCYSTRFVSTHGAPMPAEIVEGDDWYKDKLYGEYDTIVKSSVLTDKVMIKVPRERCESGELFSVEYKDTFGGNLLYLFSFGTRRKVKIKYVCMLPDL